MIRKVMRLLVFAIACLFCTSMLAQDQTARGCLLAAHAQYYTPTASGLKSFHCEAAIDWKAMLARFSANEIDDDNPFLKYLRSVHLSVADQLKGKGSLEWTDTDAPPEGKEANAKQVRDGLQTMMGGFFQSWNAYMNGSMVPYPDNTVTLTAPGSGVRLHATAANATVDEDFDQNMLLTRVTVESPDANIVAMPTYVRTGDGLLVSAVVSQINQPPSGPQTEVTFRVDYAEVNSFQLPSHLVYEVKNVGIIEIVLSACQVSADQATQKPAAETSGNPVN